MFNTLLPALPPWTISCLMPGGYSAGEVLPMTGLFLGLMEHKLDSGQLLRHEQKGYRVQDQISSPHIPGQHSQAQEGPSLGTVWEHYKGQEDPACLLKQKRSSIWADVQLPSLCRD